MRFLHHVTVVFTMCGLGPGSAVLAGEPPAPRQGYSTVAPMGAYVARSGDPAAPASVRGGAAELPGGCADIPALKGAGLKGASLRFDIEVPLPPGKYLPRTGTIGALEVDLSRGSTRIDGLWGAGGNTNCDFYK